MLILRLCVQKVESFPFNWFSDPMYLGSTLTFIAGALWCVLSLSPTFVLRRVILGTNLPRGFCSHFSFTLSTRSRSNSKGQPFISLFSVQWSLIDDLIVTDLSQWRSTPGENENTLKRPSKLARSDPTGKADMGMMTLKPATLPYIPCLLNLHTQSNGLYVRPLS
jgi:Phospholipid methyltransferase